MLTRSVMLLALLATACGAPAASPAGAPAPAVAAVADEVRTAELTLEVRDLI